MTKFAGKAEDLSHCPEEILRDGGLMIKLGQKSFRKNLSVLWSQQSFGFYISQAKMLAARKLIPSGSFVLNKYYL